ncbi:MAG: restriction endonuclease subunit S [Enorma sp.]|uniref:restriction endonuclease subunit S n=1 Tax=Enorma sp. TaxID=1920692 RepID=UPI002585B788|nr:restriction endonuclease subunit S [Enorma sp.]MCI7775469.1 restriction endonuclease subunit S [Enorma sp.]
MRLADICELVMGQSPSSASYNTEGNGLPFYQGNADFGEICPTPSTWCTDPKKKAGKGDILISVRAPIGAINIATEECCIGRGLAAIRPKTKAISTEYLLHMLLANREKMEEMGTGSTFKAVSKRALSEYPVPIYEKAEQVEIGRRLAVVLGCIKTKRQQLDKLDQLVKSQFVEMFENGEWRQARLSDCCCSPDDIKCGPFGSQLHKEDYRAEGVPVWGVPEVNSAFRSMPQKYVCVEDADRLNAYSLMGGDIALSRKGNVGNAALFDGSMPNGIIHSDVLRIRVDREKLDPLFLVHQFHSSHFVRNQIMSVSAGAIMAGTNVTKLKRIMVTVPPLPLQQQFSSFVEEVDKSRFVARKSAELIMNMQALDIRPNARLQ